MPCSARSASVPPIVPAMDTTPDTLRSPPTSRSSSFAPLEAVFVMLSLMPVGAPVVFQVPRFDFDNASGIIVVAEPAPAGDPALRTAGARDFLGHVLGFPGLLGRALGSLASIAAGSSTPGRWPSPTPAS